MSTDAPGERLFRAIAAAACIGGGLVSVALMIAMDRWMIG